MSELKSAVFGMALFVGVIIPFLLMIGIDALHQHAFLKTTAEVSELVKEEGGVSNHVKSVTKNLEKSGYNITYSKPSVVQFGEEIVIRYQYQYRGVWEKKKLDTRNKVVVKKRSSTNVGENPGGDNQTNKKTFSVTTAESLKPNEEYTFTIPGLKELQGTVSDTGDVEVVKVNGDKVTVKVSKGAISKTVQTGGEYIPADTKWVKFSDKGLSNAYWRGPIYPYNKDGYVGTLNFVKFSGTAKSRMVEAITFCVHRDRYGEYVFRNGKWEQTSASRACTSTLKHNYTEKIGGEITWVGTLKDYTDNMFSEPLIVDERETIMNPQEGDHADYDTYLGERIFTGLVYDKSSGTISYDYEGMAARAEKDTRTYADYYKYNLIFEYIADHD
ncbi:MAG: hypothetical protein RR595_09485 [Lysinibacillus sp.]